MDEVVTAEESAAVEEAATELDGDTPDWYTRVDPETLDLFSLCGCLFGQVFEQEADEDGYDSNGYGWAMHNKPSFFDTEYDAAGVFSDNTFRPAWIAAINERRAASATRATCGTGQPTDHTPFWCGDAAHVPSAASEADA